MYPENRITNTEITPVKSAERSESAAGSRNFEKIKVRN